MYNIGINVNLKEAIASYIAVLEQKGYSIIDLADEQSVQEADIIFIQEDMDRNLTDVCEQILTFKAKSNALIWILSANFSQINRVIYLQLGADFIIDLSHEETTSFILQVENTMKRFKRTSASVDINDYTTFTERQMDSKLQLHPDRLRVSVDNQPEIQLTPLEFMALSTLKKHEGELVTYENLFSAIWKNADSDRQYRLNNLIFHLRKKIEKDTSKPVFITTIRSKGYMLIS